MNIRIILTILSSILSIYFAGATPYNIAPKAQVSASSSMDGFDASHINDGIIRQSGRGEWVSNSDVTFWGEINYPWIQLDWEQPIFANKVIIYDRPTYDCHAAGGRLIFSDGSSSVCQIPRNGAPKVVEFDRPIDRMDGWVDRKRSYNITSFEAPTIATPRNEGMSYSDAPSAGVSAHFNLPTGTPLHVRMAISYVSITNAEENLAQSNTDDWDFDRIRTNSQHEWNEYLSRIVVKGSSNNDRTKFYTDLWHVLLGRHKIDDHNGQYPDYSTGKQFRIVTHNNTPTNCYINRILLNNAEFQGYSLPHSALSKGGTLDIHLSNMPKHQSNRTKQKQ